ncbi:distal membrane-arm assembly complex protein 1 [Fukomys damarensis]|uniref:distal membrane-arm assembly complex protein 1 n=1 Tax=Fukomys damarensis TaxID=885580 RepID=UPI001455136B|nr:distal membrane-arm assembly complex protein 1 [Fukomys damarensis]
MAMEREKGAGSGSTIPSKNKPFCAVIGRPSSKNYISQKSSGFFRRNALARCFPAVFTLDRKNGFYGWADIHNMGSTWTGTLENTDPVKIPVPREVAPPANPTTTDASEVQTTPAQTPLFKNCWSCRLMSGSGLIAAGAYVYLVSRRPLKLGFAPGPGTLAKMTFGISIACWGVVILIDPKGKAYRVA